MTRPTTVAHHGLLERDRPRDRRAARRRRLDRLRDRAQARDAGRAGGARLPDAGARRHRRGLDAGGGRGGGGRARRGRRARQQRRLQPVRRDRDRADGEGARAVRDERVRTRAPVPARAARDAAAARGQIVNLSSMGGKLVFPGGGFYHATKYAVEAISDALRFEVKGFGIDVILIEPGLIRTEFGDDRGGRRRARRARARATTRSSTPTWRRATEQSLRERRPDRAARRPARGGRQGDREGAGRASARAPATPSRPRRSC